MVRTSPSTPVPHVRICGRPALGERPPLPAGHPTSWALLTGGTLLDGSDYPFPVFGP